MLLLIFLWGFLESTFQEICSRAENFLILSFSSPGRGARSTIQEKTNNPPRIPDTNFHLAREAKHLHEQTYKSQLTNEPPFGLDLLRSDDALVQKRSGLFQTNFDIAKIFREVKNGQFLKFKQAIRYYITTTNRLS